MTLAMQPNRYVTTFVRVTSSATGSPQNVFGRGIALAIVSRAGDESRSNDGISSDGLAQRIEWRPIRHFELEFRQVRKRENKHRNPCAGTREQKTSANHLGHKQGDSNVIQCSLSVDHVLVPSC
jgi:hypothetical protein